MIPVIAEPPEPPNVTLPYLPIFNISQEDLDQENYEKIAKAYKVSIVELQKHIKELHTILDGYRQ